MTPRIHLIEVAAWWALLILAFGVLWFVAATRRPLPYPAPEEVQPRRVDGVEAAESNPEINQGEMS